MYFLRHIIYLFIQLFNFNFIRHGNRGRHTVNVLCKSIWTCLAIKYNNLNKINKFNKKCSSSTCASSCSSTALCRHLEFVCLGNLTNKRKNVICLQWRLLIFTSISPVLSRQKNRIPNIFSCNLSKHYLTFTISGTNITEIVRNENHVYFSTSHK